MEDYSYYVLAGGSLVRAYLNERYEDCLEIIKQGDGVFITFNPCEDSFEAFVENITGYLEVVTVADEHKKHFEHLIK